MSTKDSIREGSLQAPTRHPLDWQNPDFYQEESLFKELERIFDICHGCRRCFSLCNAFPTLFDAIDDSNDGELHGVARSVYWKVVDHCYLCDICYMTKCPYVPPHEYNLDFPHLMLRAKAVKYRTGETCLRDRLITQTDTVGKLASQPLISSIVNKANQIPLGRKVLEKVLAIHPKAVLPSYHCKTLAKRVKQNPQILSTPITAGTNTKGRVALFATCYGNYNEPTLGEDLIKVFTYNGIEVQFITDSRCCGMPRLELGDLPGVNAAKEHNIPRLAALVDAGYDIVAPVPSCVLMFKQELPLMYPNDPNVAKVKAAMFDPFEYLMLRHKENLLNIHFKKPLGKIAYHVPCHLRVQNIGLKTRECLQLIPGTQVEVIERCSGHNGTYAVKSEFHEDSMKIAKHVVNRIVKFEADWYGSDCPMAGHHIKNGMQGDKPPVHPMTLLRIAYGING